jgi:hypothetical protein
LYKIDLPLKTDDQDEMPEVPAEKLPEGIPHVLVNHHLYNVANDLYLYQENDSTIYRLDWVRHQWSPYYRSPGERNYLNNGHLCTYTYEQRIFTIKVFEIDLPNKRLKPLKSYYCPGIIDIDPYRFYSGLTGDYITVHEENTLLKVYQLSSAKPKLIKAFENIDAYEVDDQVRFLQTTHDRKQETIRNGQQVFYDNFARPYVLDISKPGKLDLLDFGPYTHSQDIIDLQTGCYLAKDIMINSQVTSTDSTCAPFRKPGSRYSILHSQYYTALDNKGQIVMNDDYMRNANVVYQFNLGGIELTATDIFGSRFLVLFDFAHSKIHPAPFTVPMHAVDL